MNARLTNPKLGPCRPPQADAIEEAGEHLDLEFFVRNIPGRLAQFSEKGRIPEELDVFLITA